MTTNNPFRSIDGTGRYFGREEIFAFGAAGALFIACIPLLWNSSGILDFAGYCRMVGIAVSFLIVGLFYRLTDRSQTVASTMIIAASVILYFNALGIFNYSLMPIDRPVIDQLLIRVDSRLGFVWPEFVALAGEYPVFNNIMKLVYNSVVPQIILLLAYLGFLGRTAALHRMVLIFILTGIPLVLFWFVFPSHGPTAFFELTPEAIERTKPLVTPEYGGHLAEMLREGPAIITPNDLKGLIAFPSYHACLAITCTYCAYISRVTVLFWLLLVTNIIMMPATIVHGGHHLIDIPAALPLFLLGVWGTEKTINWLSPSVDDN